MKEIDTIFLDQYNKELDEANAEIESGKYVEHDDVVKLFTDRRKKINNQMKRHNTIVNQIKEAITQIDPTATAILFGSRATGKAGKDSDWDILILLNKQAISLNDEQLFRDNLYDVELEIGEHISSLFHGAEDWNTRLSVTPLYKSIQQDGIIL